MKILFLTKNSWKTNWYSLWKEELKKHTEISFFGEGNKENPDILLEDLHKNNIDSCLVVAGLPTKKDRGRYLEKLIKVDTTKINILFDYNILNEKDLEREYWNGISDPEYDEFLNNMNFSMLIAFNRIAVNYFKNRYPVILQTTLSYSPDFFFEEQKTIDVFSSASTMPNLYPCRKGVNRFLKSLTGINLLTKHMDFNNYSFYIRKSKILVNSGNKFLTDCVSIKYLEAMASGTLVLTTKPTNLEDYGFIIGKHLVVYETFNELEEKLLYYLKNDDERLKIISEAKKVVESYTNKKVISGLCNKLTIYLKEKNDR